MTEDIKKGLLGIVVDETEVSKVMPEINSLTYRGYAAQDLCAKCKFEEVAYLILNGELPDNKQLKSFEKIERKERKLSKSLLDSIKNFPKKSHPMDVARTAVSIMGLEDQETKDQPQKMQEEDDEDLEYWIEYDGKDYDKDSGLQDRKFIFYDKHLERLLLTEEILQVKR